MKFWALCFELCRYTHTLQSAMGSGLTVIDRSVSALLWCFVVVDIQYLERWPPHTAQYGEVTFQEKTCEPRIGVLGRMVFIVKMFFIPLPVPKQFVLDLHKEGHLWITCC